MAIKCTHKDVNGNVCGYVNKDETSYCVKCGNLLGGKQDKIVVIKSDYEELGTKIKDFEQDKKRLELEKRQLEDRVKTLTNTDKVRVEQIQRQQRNLDDISKNGSAPVGYELVSKAAMEEERKRTLTQISKYRKEYEDVMNRPDINIGELLKIEALAGMTVWERFKYEYITKKGLLGIFHCAFVVAVVYLPFILVEKILIVYDLHEWWMSAGFGILVSLFFLYVLGRRWIENEKYFDSDLLGVSFSISCISCFFYCLSNIISDYLGIIIIIHLIAILILFYSLYYFYNAIISSPLERAFVRLGYVSGMSLKEIQAKVGKYNNSNMIEFYARGKRIAGKCCTWSDGKFSCSLLFDLNDICVGFEDK